MSGKDKMPWKYFSSLEEAAARDARGLANLLSPPDWELLRLNARIREEFRKAEIEAEGGSYQPPNRPSLDSLHQPNRVEVRHRSLGNSLTAESDVPVEERLHQERDALDPWAPSELSSKRKPDGNPAIKQSRPPREDTTPNNSTYPSDGVNDLQTRRAQRNVADSQKRVTSDQAKTRRGGRPTSFDLDLVKEAMNAVIARKSNRVVAQALRDKKKVSHSEARNVLNNLKTYLELVPEELRSAFEEALKTRRKMSKNSGQDI